MKLFTDPEGLFIVRLPIEWQYCNIAAGYEEKSPYSFALYDEPDTAGSFQISCYPLERKTPNTNVQKANTYNLNFLPHRMDDKEFNVHLWYATVEDHYLIVKYIYSKKRRKTRRIREELKKVKATLANMSFVSEDRRKSNLAYFRLEKFEAALAASADLRKHAEEHGAMIEVTLIVASQIDAYLRLCILMKKQLIESTNELHEKYIYQGNKDKPITERAIYKEAVEMNIISDNTFDSLSALYGERNKVVHRFIVSEIFTRELLSIALRYQRICEEVRLITKNIEDEQRSKRIGIYAYSAAEGEEISRENLGRFFAGVNDKHLIEEIKRKI